jgi:hypothetical protein
MTDKCKVILLYKINERKNNYSKKEKEYHTKEKMPAFNN